MTFTDKEDISLEEMLGAPQLTKFSTGTPGQRRPSTAQHSLGDGGNANASTVDVGEKEQKVKYDEDAVDGLYIAEYSRKGSKASTSTAGADLIPDRERGECSAIFRP